MQLPRKMSAQNVMASISRTLGTRNDSKTAAPNEVKLAGEESKDKLYEPKHKQKLVRVLTVVAYVISVSLAAIILSLYYTFIWDPRDNSHYMNTSNKDPVVCVNNMTLTTAETVVSGTTARMPKNHLDSTEDLNTSNSSTIMDIFYRSTEIAWTSSVTSVPTSENTSTEREKESKIKDLKTDKVKALADHGK